MKHLFIAAACAALLAGCSQGGAKSQGQFNTELPMSEYMAHAVDPAAFMYWNGSGTITTAEGTQDRTPTTEEGWETLVTGATILVEAGNTLQLPHRVREPQAEWNRMAQAMSKQAMVARAAAERHDAQAVFDEGGKLYETCQACHQKFIVEAEAAAEAAKKK